MHLKGWDNGDTVGGLINLVEKLIKEEGYWIYFSVSSIYLFI